MIFNYLFKYVIVFSLIVLLNKIKHLLLINGKNEYKFEEQNYFPNYVNLKNITNISEIYLNIVNINATFSKIYQLIEIKYYIELKDEKNNIIKPSNLSLVYNLHFICVLYIFETNEKIYSLANIQDNQLFLCIEYINITEKANFGIKIYKINELNEKVEYFQHFFFTDNLINHNFSRLLENNNKFEKNYINNNYNKLLYKINQSNKKATTFNESMDLKTSYLKPPLSYKKREIALAEGRWYYNNIFENYFCFCRGESCINIRIFNNYIFQYCKYYFYLTIIDNTRHLYKKTHYLLSDFFDNNIDSVDALPIFEEMIKENLNAHYLTMSTKIYNRFCLLNKNYCNNLTIIYGIRKIDGNFLEQYLELLLKLKVVIAAEKYESFDNIFYNIEYITYIFLGHGVQFIKSYLFNDYQSYKNYNKILLPPSKIFVDIALNAGWNDENIIKICLPKWDNYSIFNKTSTISKNKQNKEKSIFLMFTWRKVKIGRNMSELYYSNLNKLFYNTNINEQFQKNNIKLYYCYHHNLKEKRRIKTNKNIIYINQNDISTLLKNSSLIITDFSSILFDAIVQKKPLILYIPDGLDINLKDLYSDEYYETITKLKNGAIYLYELFFDLKDVVNKIFNPI